MKGCGFVPIGGSAFALRPRPSGFSLFSSQPASSDANVTAWITAVYAAGGSMSQATATAATNLVTTLKSASIWSKLYMLDLCCGNDLTSALVRLLVPGGVARAYTNHNFVSGDYSETTGLTGDGSTKYLGTGINPNAQAWDVGSFIEGVYVRSLATTGTNQNYLSYTSSGSPTGTTNLVYNNATVKQQGFIGSGSGASAPQFAASTGLVAIGVKNGDRPTTTIWQNGVNVITGNSGTSGVFPNGNMVSFATVNITTTTVSTYCIQPLTTKFMSDGTMSDANMTSLYNAIQTFETALGRNV